MWYRWGRGWTPAQQAETGSVGVCPDVGAELELPSGCRAATVDSAASERPPDLLQDRIIITINHHHHKEHKENVCACTAV